MVDVTEILIHWHAGRSQSQIASSLGRRWGAVICLDMGLAEPDASLISDAVAGRLVVTRHGVMTALDRGHRTWICRVFSLVQRYAVQEHGAAISSWTAGDSRSSLPQGHPTHCSEGSTAARTPSDRTRGTSRWCGRHHARRTPVTG